MSLTISGTIDPTCLVHLQRRDTGERSQLEWVLEKRFRQKQKVMEVEREREYNI